ncbi:hypothetical protein CIB93_26865 [Streptomyces sp. WZ.A104]|uniref:hypothetical protein n=1 Tax=Streptomyces sp. WZ.A104 TaxID=2023771 RepID=UPI000BBC3DE3|nr:hypothetical protein [Streptomyces sp. WZ.A104]PCG82983.1 hypothetical protein CIB93_26865 [Streptomyces sp. WZ.A104]
MSQPVPPPNQPQQPYGGQPQPYGGQPAEGNPYASQPGQPTAPTGNPYGQQPPAPTGNPFAAQQPGQPGPYGGAPFAPAPPPAPARNNIALGVLVALGAAIVAGILYGVIAGSIEREVGYAAIGVGFLTGFAASKVGGRNPAIVAAAALFSLGAVYLGQLVGMSMVMADVANIPFSEVFVDHFDTVTKIWKEESDFMTYLFLALGPIAAIGGAKKAG